MYDEVNVCQHCWSEPINPFEDQHNQCRRGCRQDDKSKMNVNNKSNEMDNE